MSDEKTVSDPATALNASLWEHFNALAAKIEESASRLELGDDAYDYSRELSAEVRRIEHEAELAAYRAAVLIGTRNRARKP